MGLKRYPAGYSGKRLSRERAAALEMMQASPWANLRERIARREADVELLQEERRQQEKRGKRRR